MQTTGPDPKQMNFVPGNINFGPSTSTAFVFLANPNVFQVRTSLIVGGPAGGQATFAQNGRSGPAVFTWCPGQTFPANGSVNPSCVNPVLSAPAVPQASIRYEAGVNQFGGVSQPTVGGGANVALRVGGSYAPCKHTLIGGPNNNCKAAFSQVVPNTIGVGGGPLTSGNVQTAFPANPNIYPIYVTAAGSIISRGATLLGTFPANNVVASYGAPWTTGKVTVKAPTAMETFYLQGFDNRVDGIGSISLVQGGVSNRSLSLDNANRGWQNLVVAPFSAPAISNGGLMLLAGLFLASGLWMMRRAFATS